MAPKRSKRGANKYGSGRDSGGFVAVPWSVLDCLAFALLSHPARSLLIEFARQYVGDNNGRLLASGKYLNKRGWHSADVIHRAKKELIQAGFIFETVKGHRPNKASWYAITWQNLDKLNGYDACTWAGWRDARSGYSKSIALKIKPLNPSCGVGKSITAPSRVVGSSTVAPSSGAINNGFESSSNPSNGNHLDIPSTKDRE